MKKRTPAFHLFLGVSLLISLALPLPAADAPAAQTGSAEKKAEPPANHTLKRGTLKREVKLDAVFEAAEMRPLKLEPKVWVDLTVLEAVPHGTRVKKGDVVLKIDAEKIQEQVDDLEDAQPAARVALELGVAELENLVETTPLKLEAARRLKKRTDEDQAYFEKTDKAQREKAARWSVKSGEDRLEGAREELRQLEKMYKADDLTEETEEIILKRQRFAVESSEYFLETARLGSDRNLKNLIPREEENFKTQKQDQALALTLAEQSLPRALTQKRLSVDKLKRDQKKSDKKLADLKADLQSLTVKAPIDGVVYYGACENGRWTTAPAVEKKLVPGGKLMPREVFMTIAQPAHLNLKSVVPENKLSKVKSGLTGRASLVSEPDTRLEVRVEDLNYVPLPAGGFLASLSVKRHKDLTLMPGMTCEVTLEGERRQETVLAPKDAVFAEGDHKFVYVQKDDGKSDKRAVKTGQSDDTMTEILEGVTDGQKILLKKPE